jgi:hypothetical protein
MARWRPAMLLVAALALAAACAGWRAEALSVTVTDTECIHEFVPYEGDSVTGNFVVVDHDIFWSSDHPGIDLTVRHPARSPASLLSAHLLLSPRLIAARGSGFSGVYGLV